MASKTKVKGKGVLFYKAQAAFWLGRVKDMESREALLVRAMNEALRAHEWHKCQGCPAPLMREAIEAVPVRRGGKRG